MSYPTYQGRNGQAWDAVQVTIRRTSDEAVLADFSNSSAEVWIPRSLIKETITCYTDVTVIHVRHWFMTKQVFTAPQCAFTSIQSNNPINPIGPEDLAASEAKAAQAKLDRELEAKAKALAAELALKDAQDNLVFDDLMEDQIQAVKEIIDFLQGTSREHLLTGGAGTGKSHTMNFIIDKVFPLFKGNLSRVKLSATTHAAVAVLRNMGANTEVSTIHSLVGVVLNDNYSDGTTTTRLKEERGFTNTLYNSLVIIDEASMLDMQMRQWILEKAEDCKILYVGDVKQLAQVKGQSAEIDKLPTSSLTIIKRSGNEALKSLYKQLADNVVSLDFGSIQTVPNVIDWFSHEQVLEYLKANIAGFTNSHAIASYTNSRVHDINAYCRELAGLPEEYVAGEKLVVGVSQSFKNGSIVEVIASKVVTIPMQNAFANVEYYALTVKQDVEGTKTIYVPKDRSRMDALIAKFVAQKDWKAYFELKNNLTDVRPMYASTSYKLQGRSVGTVLVDLTDISACWIPEVVARMLYVGASRAKTRVIFFGSLNPKYGTIV